MPELWYNFPKYIQIIGQTPEFRKINGSDLIWILMQLT